VTLAAAAVAAVSCWRKAKRFTRGSLRTVVDDGNKAVVVDNDDAAVSAAVAGSDGDNNGGGGCVFRPVRRHQDVATLIVRAKIMKMTYIT
jgi:hypothetical protein